MDIKGSAHLINALVVLLSLVQFLRHLPSPHYNRGEWIIIGSIHNIEKKISMEQIFQNL